MSVVLTPMARQASGMSTLARALGLESHERRLLEPLTDPEDSNAGAAQATGQWNRRPAASARVATSSWFRGRENAGAFGKEPSAMGKRTMTEPPVIVDGTNRPLMEFPCCSQMARAQER